MSDLIERQAELEALYHHLGKFSDEPCKRYERRAKDE